ncbi:hypothetical protein MTO96_046480, partial [Rhipicephalus appendiculatus]
CFPHASVPIFWKSEYLEARYTDIFLDLLISADSLSREEALELFFSLPDESETSEDEAESSEVRAGARATRLESR